MTTQYEVTLRVIRALEALEIPYMLVGSLSLSVHGEARATRDADLVAELRRGDGRRISAALGADFYADEETAEEAVRRRQSFGIIYMPEVFKVDIFVLGSGAFDREAFRRRLNVPLEGLPISVFVQTAEDAVLSKLKWYRMGGEVSDQQWRDILGVLKLRSGSLDTAYLRHWAEHEKVLDLLERAESQL